MNRWALLFRPLGCQEWNERQRSAIDHRRDLAYAEAKAGTKAATDLLPDKMDAGDRICERRLDRLMERYQTSNPALYGAYQVARA